MVSRSQADVEQIAADLLRSRNFHLISCKTIQSLWAGYGHICHVKAIPNECNASGVTESRPNPKPRSLILKYISPPLISLNKSHQDEGHLRKVLSYQIEQSFYTNLAPNMPKDIAVADCLASIDSGHASFGNKSKTPATAMILTDLRDHFPIAGEKRAELSSAQALAALNWLARFHGFWWTHLSGINIETCIRPPLSHFQQHKSSSLEQGGNVWLNGGYTYLDTRRTEYEALRSDEDSEWSSELCNPVTPGGLSIAELAAKILAPTSSTISQTASTVSSTSTSATASSANSGSSTPSQPAEVSSNLATFPTSTSSYLTLLHGDVKSENLFTTSPSQATEQDAEVSVAFYDFQYTGLGLGVCDLAKLFTCSVPLHMLLDPTTSHTYGSFMDSETVPMQPGEAALLRTYLGTLQEASEGREYPWDLFVRHWETALVDWCRFQASWGFWGNTEWLEARVRCIVRDREGWRSWVGSVTGEASLA